MREGEGEMRRVEIALWEVLSIWQSWLRSCTSLCYFRGSLATAFTITSATWVFTLTAGSKRSPECISSPWARQDRVMSYLTTATEPCVLRQPSPGLSLHPCNCCMTSFSKARRCSSFPRQEDVPLIFRFKLHITHNQPEPHLNYAGSFRKSIHSQFFGDQNEVVPRFLCVTAIEFFKDFMAWRLGYFLKRVFKRRRQAWVKVKQFLYEDIWSFILLVSAT